MHVEWSYKPKTHIHLWSSLALSHWQCWMPHVKPSNRYKQKTCDEYTVRQKSFERFWLAIMWPSVPERKVMSPFRNLHFKLGDAMNVIKHLVKIFTTVMIRYRLVFCSTVHIYVSSFNGFYRWFDHIGFKRPFYEILILNQIQLTYSSPYYSFC